MKIPATIAAIEQVSPSTKSFQLDLSGQDFGFLPGQWVDCYAVIDGRLEVAGYSMTSSPMTKESIDLAVKLVGDNPVTHYLHTRARVGDALQVDGGQGDFYYRRDMDDSLVLIAGGIGITPLMSITHYIDEAQPDVRVALVYCARTPSELLFRDKLAAIGDRNKNIRCLFTVTRPADEAWSGRVGRIDAGMLSEARLDLEALFYICGPPPMIVDMIALLNGLGVNRSRIKYEDWSG